jgi:hypothetical protein
MSEKTDMHICSEIYSLICTDLPSFLIHRRARSLKKSAGQRHPIMLTFSDFTAFIDSIYFEGYANQFAATDPEKLQFEFEEYRAIMA